MVLFVCLFVCWLVGLFVCLFVQCVSLTAMEQLRIYIVCSFLLIAFHVASCTEKHQNAEIVVQSKS